MRHINKNNPKIRKEALTIILKLIQNQWIDGEYYNLTYEDLDVSELENILVKEQEGYCCYCMRTLRQSEIDGSERNVTLEHIIPNHISESDFERDKARYSDYFKFDKKHIKVFVHGVWEDKKKQLKPPPFPHFVAYDNLVASCDGRTLNNLDIITPHHCCNNYREDRFVAPLFYKENVEDLIRYDSKGNIDCDEKYVRYLDERALNLMTYSFCQIRRFWRIIAQSEYTVDDILNARTDTTRRNDIIDDISDNSDRWNSVRKEIVWKLFADYSWFYYYYTRQPRICNTDMPYS